MPKTKPVRCKIVPDEQGFDLALHFNVPLHKLGTDVTIHRNKWEETLRIYHGIACDAVYSFLHPDYDDAVSAVLSQLLEELMADHTGVTLIKITPYIIYLDKSKAVENEVIAECVEAAGYQLGLSS